MSNYFIELPNRVTRSTGQWIRNCHFGGAHTVQKRPTIRVQPADCVYREGEHHFGNLTPLGDEICCLRRRSALMVGVCERRC
jgi:hypothetical protein